MERPVNMLGLHGDNGEAAAAAVSSSGESAPEGAVVVGSVVFLKDA
ncbi:MAG: hypothetical protein INR71_08280 [Terriglobus roseus]|nr:hypothetical protein [Terriglobus roseus]